MSHNTEDLKAGLSALKDMKGTFSDIESTLTNTIADSLPKEQRALLFEAVKNAKDRLDKGVSEDDIIEETRNKYKDA